MWTFAQRTHPETRGERRDDGQFRQRHGRHGVDDRVGQPPQRRVGLSRRDVRRRPLQLQQLRLRRVIQLAPAIGVGAVFAPERHGRLYGQQHRQIRPGRALQRRHMGPGHVHRHRHHHFRFAHVRHVRQRGRRHLLPAPGRHGHQRGVCARHGRRGPVQPEHLQPAANQFEPEQPDRRHAHQHGQRRVGARAAIPLRRAGTSGRQLVRRLLPNRKRRQWTTLERYSRL
jgi:hypothetical protein